ncbi:hypothetical protein DFH09DRAFT_833952, partial [Mycena vulgaris]
APSQAAQHHAMKATQSRNHQHVIYNGHPADLVGPPISVYHRVFTDFMEAASSDLSVPDKFYNTFSNLAVFTTRYMIEDRRAPDMIDALRSLFGPKFSRSVLFPAGQRIEPDGNMTTELKEFDKDPEVKKSEKNSARVVLIFEVKCGLWEDKSHIGGGGCDPVHQGEKDFQHLSNVPELASLRKVSPMPALLLTTVGSELAVTGLINLNGTIISQRLLDYTPLTGRLPTAVPPDSRFVTWEDYEHYRVARILQALDICFRALDKYYSELSPRPAHPLGAAPHFTMFATKGKTYAISYLERLVDDPNSQHRTIFVGDCTSGDQTIRCVIKFTSSYNATVHRHMEELEGAPPLLYCAQEPSVGNLWVAIMHYVDQPSERVTVSPQAFQRLRDRVASVHKKGYVFGDLRRPNILIDDKDELLVIDYDWSGPAKHKLYPRTLNTKIAWADGVEPGLPIEAAHDLGHLNML